MKKTNFSNLLLVLALVTIQIIRGQESKQESRYVVVTYETSYNKGFHGNSQYYWILPLDSIDTNTNFSPLYLAGFSKRLLDECEAGKSVSIFDSVSNDDYSFSEDYTTLREKSKKVIDDNRVKIMTVRKKWTKGLKEKINVYVTPVKGKFCTCPLDNANADLIGYEGNIFLPSQEIFLDPDSLKEFDVNYFNISKKMRLGNVINVPWR